MTFRTGNAPSRKLRVGFVLAHRFTLSAFSLFVDTLRLASDELDRSRRMHADWQVLSSSRNLIMSSCGIQVAPNSNFVEPREFDYIVVVGGLLGPEPGVDQATFDFLRKAAAQNVTLIGICTGTFILAEAGLMRSHRTCVSWLHYQAFRDQFPDHQVESRNLFNLGSNRGSCAGGSSSADMAADLVRRHISREAEKNALEVLHIEKARPPSEVQPRKPIPLNSNDPRLKAALIIMENNIERKISIDKLARSVGLCRRQLERLFKDKANCSPQSAYQRVRMEKARALVLQTDSTLIDIAVEVGITNASQFTKTFKKTFGQTPRMMRAAQLQAD